MICSPSDFELVKNYVRHVPVEGSTKAHDDYVRLVAFVKYADPTFEVNNPQQLKRLQSRSKDGHGQNRT